MNVSELYDEIALVRAKRLTSSIMISLGDLALDRDGLRREISDRVLSVVYNEYSLTSETNHERK